MDLFNKAKEFLDTVEIKAGEFVYDQKNNIKIAKVCSELKRNYEKLGSRIVGKCYAELVYIISDSFAVTFPNYSAA